MALQWRSLYEEGGVHSKMEVLATWAFKILLLSLVYLKRMWILLMSGEMVYKPSSESAAHARKLEFCDAGVDSQVHYPDARNS